MVKSSGFSIDKSALKKGAWSSEEDRKLINYIKKYKIWNWSEMSKAAGLARSGKSCRLRWVNYLRPDIKHGNFSNDEVQTIMTLHDTLGNRWASIASKLPGRTDNEVKNYWHTHLKKRLNKPFSSPKQYQNASPNTVPELEEEDHKIIPANLDDKPVDTKSAINNITDSPQPMSTDDIHMSPTANTEVEADHSGKEDVLNLMAQDNYSIFFEPESAMSDLWTYDQYFYEEALCNDWLDYTNQIF